MNILITRPREDAEKTAEILRGLGHIAIIEPVLAIEFLDMEVDSPDVLLITSANSIRAFAKNSDRRDLPVYTVGDFSAAQAEKLGFSEVYSAGGDVHALEELVCERCDKATQLLHVAGRITAGDLKGNLEKKGYEVERAVLYSADPIEKFSPQAIAGFLNCEIDIVLFYSPRSAEIFMQLAQEGRISYLLKSSKALCLSKAVADVASKGNWAEILTAEKPTEKELLALIEEG